MQNNTRFIALAASLKLPYNNPEHHERVNAALLSKEDAAHRVNALFNLLSVSGYKAPEYWITVFEALIVGHHSIAFGFLTEIERRHQHLEPREVRAFTIPIVTGILRAVPQLSFNDFPNFTYGHAPVIGAMLGRYAKNAKTVGDYLTEYDSKIVCLFSSAFNEYFKEPSRPARYQRLADVSEHLRNINKVSGGVAEEVMTEIRRCFTQHASFNVAMEVFSDDFRMQAGVVLTPNGISGEIVG